MHRNSTLIEITFLFTLELSRVALTYKIEIFLAEVKCCHRQSSSQKKKKRAEELKYTAHLEHGVWKRCSHQDRHTANLLGRCRRSHLYRLWPTWCSWILAEAEDIPGTDFPATSIVLRIIHYSTVLVWLMSQFYSSS
ncbi:hypothetical protein AV530_017971 [Patagioenas fasciata monilis]|uniref:Uncharacterized protein n=1 Tax=Patagioenas fasciata monilis TaxID=372326 RepID=A0A1V4KKD3_PATFA|nr:hypothetical protein AV530_017971 [Patagioenas fasciata monilis]